MCIAYVNHVHLVDIFFYCTLVPLACIVVLFLEIVLFLAVLSVLTLVIALHASFDVQYNINL